MNNKELQFADFLEDIDPRYSVDLIRDPIYQYIPFTKRINEREIAEEDIIKNRWVQRLKRIFQTQLTWSAYPGAVHSRFQHSLGVMHLAGIFARVLYEPFFPVARKIYKNKMSSKILKKNFPSPEYVVEVFRLAGLLHDIGHGPLSHAFDENYLKQYKITHEDITKDIIKKELSSLIKKIKRSPRGKLEKSIDPQDVIDVLYPFLQKKNFRPGMEIWKRILYKIISGLYSVDKLDFLLRDSYYAGTPEFGSVDVRRLLLTSMLTPNGLALHKSSLDASLRPFLYARVYMFMALYYHRYPRAFELSICNTIPNIMKILKLEDPRANLDKFYELDDFYLFSLCKQWSKETDPKEKEKKEIGRKWIDAWNGNWEWEEVFYVSLFVKKEDHQFFRWLKDPKRMKKSVEDALFDHFKKKGSTIPEFIVDTPSLYIRPENPLTADKELAILIYDPSIEKKSSRLSEKRFVEIIEDLPLILISFRIFSKKKDKDLVKKACNEVFSDSIRPRYY